MFYATAIVMSVAFVVSMGFLFFKQNPLLFHPPHQPLIAEEAQQQAQALEIEKETGSRFSAMKFAVFALFSFMQSSETNI